MSITGTINVALNGFEAGVTSKREAHTLITERIGELAGLMAADTPIELLDLIGSVFGIGFEMSSGKIDNIVFQ